jgi:hypothetical protein
MRATSHRCTSPRRRRRGFVISTELVVLLPLVFALVMAVIEFSLLELGRQRVNGAARAGARVAAMPGATMQDIDQAVAFAMTSAPLAAARHVDVRQGPYSGDPVIVYVAVPMKAATPDLLGIVGFGLGKRLLVGSCVMRKE